MAFMPVSNSIANGGTQECEQALSHRVSE